MATETEWEGYPGIAHDFETLKLRYQELVDALRDLTERCDGEEGVRADGSNIQTMRAHAILNKTHPDYGTPNWCPVCSPKNIGYCRCEIASNE